MFRWPGERRDLPKIIGLEAGAADERAVHVGYGEQFRSIRILDAPFLSEFLVRTFSQAMRLPEPDGATDRSRPGRTWCA